MGTLRTQVRRLEALYIQRYREVFQRLAQDVHEEPMTEETRARLHSIAMREGLVRPDEFYDTMEGRYFVEIAGEELEEEQPSEEPEEPAQDNSPLVEPQEAPAEQTRRWRCTIM